MIANAVKSGAIFALAVAIGLSVTLAVALAAFLAGAELEIAEQYGDWDRSALRPGNPEIITIANALRLTSSNICSIVMEWERG